MPIPHRPLAPAPAPATATGWRPALVAAGLLAGLAGCATLAPATDGQGQRRAQVQDQDFRVSPDAPRLSPTGSAVGDAVTGTLTLVLLLYLGLTGLRRH